MDARVAIVGAGPIGLELAVALKKEGVSYVQFDARQLGYTVSWFPNQTRFFSSNERIAIAGVPLQTPDQMKATREEYLTYLRGIVEQFDLKVNAYERVVGINRRQGGGYTITTEPRGERRTYVVESVVLATGGTDQPNRLNVPGEELPHVSHYFHDPHTYFRQRVVVVGGKNSAVEAALRCHHAGARVALSYRGAQLPSQSIKYWLMPEISGLLESRRIEPYFNTCVSRITPTHVTLIDPRTREQTDVPADFVLLLVGYVADMTLFKIAGVELRGEQDAPAFDERTMETNVPGVYVAGTAAGGTQRKYTLFLENCHVHVERIVRALTGRGGGGGAIAAPVFARPES